jgi:integrase
MYGSAESRDRYDTLIKEWLEQDRQPIVADAVANEPRHEFTIAEMVLGFLDECERNYPPTDGKKNRELYAIESAMTQLVVLFGTTVAKNFGPRELKRVRQAFVDKKICRKVVNRYVQFVRNAFRFGVTEGMVSGENWHQLCAVRNLRRGSGESFDYEEVQPVDEEVYFKTLPHLSKEVRAIAELQYYSGARQGEICIMRAMDIDMTREDVWLYRPERHKNVHRGQDRVIPLGPRCQAIIRPFLTGTPDKYLFSPKASESRRRHEAHTKRVTPLSYGNAPGTNRSDDPRRPPGEHYTSSSYRRAIFRATSKAFEFPEELKPDTQRMNKAARQKFIKDRGQEEFEAHHANVLAWYEKHHWHPHQLRHRAATVVAREFGEASAMSLLGQKNLSTTQIYIARDLMPAIEVMKKVG